MGEWILGKANYFRSREVECKTRPNFTQKSGFSKQERGFGDIQTEKGRKGFSITQEELDAKKEEFFARGGRVEKLGYDFQSVRINPIKDNDTRYLIDSIRTEVDSNLSASRRHLRTSLYGD